MPFLTLTRCAVQIAMGVADEKLQPQLPAGLPTELLALTAACCDFDPEMRPSFAVLVPELEAAVETLKVRGSAASLTKITPARAPWACCQHCLWPSGPRGRCSSCPPPITAGRCTSSSCKWYYGPTHVHEWYSCVLGIRAGQCWQQLGAHLQVVWFVPTGTWHASNQQRQPRHVHSPGTS